MADARTTLAKVLIDFADYAQARTLLEQALPIHELAFGGVSFGVAFDDYLLGAAAEASMITRGRWTPSERARGIFETSGYEGMAAICVRRIANVVAAVGDTVRAERCSSRPS